MSRNINPFALRMPVELRAQVEAAAKASGRSVNSEIVKRLEASFVGDQNAPLGWEELKLLPPAQQDVIKAVIRAMLPAAPLQ